MFQSSAASKAASAVLYSSWVMFAVLVGSSLLAGLLILPFSSTFNLTDNLSALASVILYAIQYILALVVVMIVPFIQVTGKWSLLIPMLGVHRWPTFKDALLAIPSWAVYFTATLIVLSLIAIMAPTLNLDQEQDIGFDGISHLYEYILAFIALVVLPPIAEEMIFRGYLFGKLRSFLKFWPTTIAVSLAFAIVHLQLNVGIDVFILSIALCYLREKSGNIWASVFLHAIKNFVAYIFLFDIKLVTNLFH
jgi:membrane protease YdiL (CAAX protease family)